MDKLFNVNNYIIFYLLQKYIKLYKRFTICKKICMQLKKILIVTPLVLNI